MYDQNCPPKLIELHSNRLWRLENLYYIKDKSGCKIKFKLNWAQKALLSGLHNQNIILKARQLGITTFFSILQLDACMWNDGISAGIIADKRETSEDIFNHIIKFAYEALPEYVKTMNPATQDNVRKLEFKNGSNMRVSTSMRGGSLQMLHISEFGKICAQSPWLAQEIVTGSLQAVAADQFVTIESTAEGREGYFFDFCKEAQDAQASGKKLSALEMKFFFFPWHQHLDYMIYEQVVIPAEEISYFEGLRNKGIDLNNEQKWWYTKKHQQLKESMMQEYPSTPEESFFVANKGLVYGKDVQKIRHLKQVSVVPYVETLPVHTGWDLGYADSTAIWFFQLHGPHVRVINYLEANGESLAYYARKLKELGYMYGEHFLPHDAAVHDLSNGLSRKEILAQLGINATICERRKLDDSKELVRATLPSCWFDEAACSKGLSHLEAYKYEWDDKLGRYKSDPLHDEHSHAASAFAESCAGLSLLHGGTGASLKDMITMRQTQRWMQ